MSWKLNLEELTVTSFETSATATLVMEYTPDCCTDDGSGCKTGPETGCNTDEHDCATVETQEQVERFEHVGAAR